MLNLNTLPFCVQHAETVFCQQFKSRLNLPCLCVLFLRLPTVSRLPQVNVWYMHVCRSLYGGGGWMGVEAHTLYHLTAVDVSHFVVIYITPVREMSSAITGLSADKRDGEVMEIWIMLSAD